MLLESILCHNKAPVSWRHLEILNGTPEYFPGILEFEDYWQQLENLHSTAGTVKVRDVFLASQIEARH